jgi:hypothetical protein
MHSKFMLMEKTAEHSGPVLPTVNTKYPGFMHPANAITAREK